MTERCRERRARARDAQQEAVGRAEAYLRANPDAPLRLAALCRLVGLSERGLRNAFYGVHGVSPARWMRDERLHGARRALASPLNGPTTVTAVATAHGFHELGRFAAVYRDVFGEVPSATLRGATRPGVMAMMAGRP